jgi:long-chain acyl-CoA synthetase
LYAFTPACPHALLLLLLSRRHVVLVGQDKRELGALVFPDEEVVAATGVDADVAGVTSSSSSSKALEGLLFQEVTWLNKARPEYHPEDHIGHIQVWGGG